MDINSSFNPNVIVSHLKHNIWDNRSSFEKSLMVSNAALMTLLRQPMFGIATSILGSYVWTRYKFKDIETTRHSLHMTNDIFNVQRIGKSERLEYADYKYIISDSGEVKSDIGNVSSLFLHQSDGVKTALGDRIYAGLYRPDGRGNFNMTPPNSINQSGHYLSVDGANGCSYYHKGLIGVKFTKYYNNHYRTHGGGIKFHKHDVNEIYHRLDAFLYKRPNRLCYSTDARDVNSLDVITIGKGEEVAVLVKGRLIVETDRKLLVDGISFDGVNCYDYPINYQVIYAGDKLFYCFDNVGIFNYRAHFRLHNVYNNQDEFAQLQVWS